MPDPDPAKPSLEHLAGLAAAGDPRALSSLCQALEAPVYRLALRMLGDPSDAEDAAQEILVKVVTNLGAFEGRSALTTWVHRIAVRHVLALRRGRAEQRALAPEQLAELLDRGMAFGATQPAATPEDQVLVHEIQLSCTQGMLLMLGRDERLAIVLIDLLGFDGAEAADIVETSHAAFRQRLARARDKLGSFLTERCGVVEPTARCRCAGQVAGVRARGTASLRLAPLAVEHLDPPDEVELASAELRHVRAIGAAFHRGGKLAAPAAVRTRLFAALRTVLAAPE